jgi:GT2 family glycosyltransferase
MLQPFTRGPDATRGVATLTRAVVFVTAPVADVEAALGLVRQVVGRDLQVVYVVSPNDDLAPAYLSAGPSQVIVCPPAWLGLIRTAWRLRHLPHDVTVVLFSRSRGHRRLKLMSMYVGRGRLLVCQEAGDAFFAGVRSLTRHAAWRVREQLRIQLHRASSAWRLFSSRGLSGLAQRIGQRIARRFNRLGLRVRFWWSGIAWSRFALPADPDPDVSLVIPVHGKWRVTRRCLRSIALNSEGVRYEVVLVDDGSPDDTRAAARRVTGLKVVAFDENRGFVAACNAGASAATGRYVLFLNNDTVVTPGWLPPLLRTFAEQRDCGAVGAKLVYPNGRLQEAGSIVWREGDGYNYGKHDNPALPEYNYVRRTDYCSGAVLMVRRDVFASLGGFDEQFEPGYWEDADLCFRLADKGLAVWFQPASVVYHLEGTTAGTHQSRGMKRFQAENRDKFRRKWAAALTRQPPFDPRQLFLARDRNRGPFVLVFDHYVPTPDHDAGSVFMDRLLTELTHLGCRVVFWPENLFASPGYTERLQQQGIEVMYGAVSLDDYLRRLGRTADAAIAYRSHVAAKFLPIARVHSHALGYILCDLESLRESRRVELDGEDGSEFRVVAAT